MPNLLAMSFEGELAPSFTLRCLEAGRTLPDGWGLGYFPAGEPSAAILKEPAPPQASMRSQLALAWEQVASSVFVLHIRHATWGALSDANTQPFARPWGRRDWLMAHAGSLDRKGADVAGPFEPVGSTDTEQVFCGLLNRFVEHGWRSIAEVELAALHDWLTELNAIGELTLCLSDGRDLLLDADLEIDLTRRGAKSRKGIVACTDKLAPHGDDAATALVWRQLEPGQLLVVREGAVIATRGEPAVPRSSGTFAAVAVHDLHRPSRAEPRTYDVVHRTVYRYEKEIERSQHLLRLTPVHDHLQAVRAHELAVSVPAQSRDYEDVFGNRVRRLRIETPFTEMVIESKSVVAVLDV